MVIASRAVYFISFPVVVTMLIPLVVAADLTEQLPSPTAVGEGSGVREGSRSPQSASPISFVPSVPPNRSSPPLHMPVERGPGGEAAQVPQIPATFYGSATIDGKAPPEGSVVRGIIGGLDCTQPGAAGTITADGVGAYVISVMHETQKPGCGKEGSEVTFTIAGRLAGQSATWKPGPQQLGLNAGSGEVQPLPSNVPIPTEAAPTASAVPPTGDIQLPGGKTTTPLPPGTSDDTGADDDDGPGIAGLAIVALFAIAVVAGAAGMVFSRRKPPDPPPPSGRAGDPT